MTATPLKFYQVGSFAVGNRLLTDEERSEQSNPDRVNALTSGHRACQGCGEALGARYVLDTAMAATGGKVMAVNATGCLEVFSTPYPETSWRIPWLHSLFGNAAAVASGVAAAMAGRSGWAIGSWAKVLRRCKRFGTLTNHAQGEAVRLCGARRAAKVVARWPRRNLAAFQKASRFQSDASTLPHVRLAVPRTMASLKRAEIGRAHV